MGYICQVMGSFFRGLGYPYRAVGFVRQHGLTRFVVAPLLLSALLYALFFVSLYFWFGQVSDWIWARPAGGGLWGAVLGFFWQVFRGALGLLLVGLGAILFVLIAQVLSAPFLDLLSEKTEEIVLGRTPKAFTLSRALAEVRYALLDLLRVLLLLGGLNVLLLFLHLVPGVGTLANAAANALWTLLFGAYAFLDYPLSRRHIPFGGKWRVVLRSPSLSLGFGAAVFATLLVPIVGLFLLPFACVGGTLLFCDLALAGGLGQRLGSEAWGQR